MNTTNSGAFNFKNFYLKNTEMTPIIVPNSCCYFSFTNSFDSMILKSDLNSLDELYLPIGVSQLVTATYFRADYRFNSGDILFFAKGVNNPTSTANLVMVKR